MAAPEQKKTIKLYLDIALGVVGLASLMLLTANAGFYLSPSQLETSSRIIDFIVVIYIVQEAARWFLTDKPMKYLRGRWIENALAIFLLFELFFPRPIMGLLSSILPDLSVKQLTILYLSIIEIVIFSVLIIRGLRYNYLISKINLHPGAVLALSFASFIFIGAALLALPRAVPPGESISALDALFTATSAVCVTGLTVVDTASFAPFGKIVILLLIQIGGLGIMTLTTFFALVLAGGLSVRARVLMKDLLSQESVGEVRILLLKITALTLSIEAAGAFFLYLSLGGELTYINSEYLYTSVFHSVSAFCNAGFSLYSDGLMNERINGAYLFSTIIMILIILGGLGFIVLSNILKLRPRWFSKKRLRYQLTLFSRIVLTSSGLLLLFGAALIFFSEPFDYGGGHSFFERVYHSFFLSATARTAGFNTVPTASIAAPAVMILIPLMWIGASPGSTGGGIKTTAFSLGVLSLIRAFRGDGHIKIFNRQIAPDSAHRAFMVVISSLIALFVGSVALIWMEPDKEPLDLIFEAVSALGTVGLSRNVTSSLGAGGKAAVIALMFIGRIGVLTFILAFSRAGREPRYSLPEENIIVG